MTRGGEEMVQITPVPPKSSLTIGELFELLDRFPVDASFADDLEEIHAQQGLAPENPWPT